MRRRAGRWALCALAMLGTGCARDEPAPWDGPVLVQQRTQLTVAQLQRRELLPLVDMSFFARPAWAQEADEDISHDGAPALPWKLIQLCPPERQLEEAT